MFPTRDLSIRVELIIQHLVFVADCGAARFQNEIFQTAVSARFQLPFPLQIELFVLTIRKDVPSRFSQTMEPAILDDPAFRRGRGTFEGVPAMRSTTIKQQFPTARLFLR